MVETPKRRTRWSSCCARSIDESSAGAVAGGSANAYDYALQDPVNAFDLDGRYVSGGAETDEAAGKSGTDSGCHSEACDKAREKAHHHKKKKKHRGWWRRHWKGALLVTAGVVVVLASGGTGAFVMAGLAEGLEEAAAAEAIDIYAHMAIVGVNHLAGEPARVLRRSHVGLTSVMRAA